MAALKDAFGTAVASDALAELRAIAAQRARPHGRADLAAPLPCRILVRDGRWVDPCLILFAPVTS
ncbi:MAG: hypothetical protein O7G30_17505, partial [Proteobacteria bacterium]|nr:hypothetical protein [Pseudomonadota bacterium]